MIQEFQSIALILNKLITLKSNISHLYPIVIFII